MTEHNLFYYPYASFTNAQLPLLKVAALYFDKLFILDPVGASWDAIGADHHTRDAVPLLKDAGILEIVMPQTVLTKYENPISEAIRLDMGDRKFLELCEAQSRATGKQRWTLSLAKVPQDLQSDQVMRHLMGEFARDVANKTAYAADDYIEHIEAISSLPGNDRPVPIDVTTRATEYREYAEGGQAYNEYHEGYDADVEYRYADFPLALGEAIMMNHALFAGLHYVGATPITNDPFHNQALELKLRRATQDPIVQQVRAERAQQQKANLLALTALNDTQLKLPIIDPALPLEEVLEYRTQHGSDLLQAREKLGWLARRIKAEPWSADFINELNHKTIPDLAEVLGEAGKARDSWLKSKRTRFALKAAGVAAGAATAVLAVFTAPATPIALATAGLGLATGVAIPGAEWLLDWRDGQKTVQENGLHYLLQI